VERDFVLKEFDRLKAKDVIISSNVPLRQDGLPYSGFAQRNIPDKGIAAYFMLNGERKVLACDAWDTWETNLRAIGLSIAAMRALERHQCTQVVERAFTGFKAIPERTGGKPWTEVLGIGKDSSELAIKTSYLILAKVRHPDVAGGSQEAFTELAEAYNQALVDRGFK
jgi:hypothetical protein